MMAGSADSGEPREDTPLARSDEPVAVAAPTHHLRAVVVDDHPDIRELLRIQLDRSPDITVVGVASDGVEAIALTERLQPDVVLLDLGLPRLSGLEALPHLRAASADVKIIALSGFEEGSQAREARAAGVDAYVEKGLSMQLAQVIRDVCAADTAS